MDNKLLLLSAYKIKMEEGRLNFSNVIHNGLTMRYPSRREPVEITISIDDEFQFEEFTNIFHSQNKFNMFVYSGYDRKHQCIGCIITNMYHHMDSMEITLSCDNVNMITNEHSMDECFFV